MKNEFLSKSYSRFFAVQILFSYFYEKNDKIEDLEKFFENNYISNEFSMDKKDEYKKYVNVNFLNKLLTKTLEHIENIDKILIKNINYKNSFENLDKLIQIIFKLSLYEFIYTNTKKKIIINEYVDISAEYFDKKTVAFINANLDKLSKIEYNNENI